MKTCVNDVRAVFPGCHVISAVRSLEQFNGKREGWGRGGGTTTLEDFGNDVIM